MSETGDPAVPSTVTTPIDLKVKTSSVFEGNTRRGVGLYLMQSV